MRASWASRAAARSMKAFSVASASSSRRAASSASRVAPSRSSLVFRVASSRSSRTTPPRRRPNLTAVSSCRQPSARRTRSWWGFFSARGSASRVMRADRAWRAVSRRSRVLWPTSAMARDASDPFFLLRPSWPRGPGGCSSTKPSDATASTFAYDSVARGGLGAVAFGSWRTSERSGLAAAAASAPAALAAAEPFEGLGLAACPVASPLQRRAPPAPLPPCGPPLEVHLPQQVGRILCTAGETPCALPRHRPRASPGLARAPAALQSAPPSGARSASRPPLPRRPPSSSSTEGPCAAKGAQPTPHEEEE